MNRASELSRVLLNDLTALNEGRPLSSCAMTAPRRKHADPTSAELAHAVAAYMFPSPANESDNSLYSIIAYERAIISLRSAYKAQFEEEEAARLEANIIESWNGRLKAQGPWYEEIDLVPLTGPEATPMPVEISDAQSLAPFFDYLAHNGDFDGRGTKQVKREPYFNGEYVEWEKGALYQDGRMDLCKQALGPQNIGSLMSSLEKNTFVKHFLLGNNVIGPHGARAITVHLQHYPSNIITWYLAGCCIDSESFAPLAEALASSPAVRSIWLKRNPLGPSSAQSISNLIESSPSLQTLDLDLTELGDAGVADLFTLLTSRLSPTQSLPLSTLYLSANGVSASGSAALSTFLAAPACALENLYLSCNPLGTRGALALSKGFTSNKSLLRLSLHSTGLSSSGASALFTALSSHPTLLHLNVGQAYSTPDLASSGVRFNYLDDDILPSLTHMLRTLGTRTLRSLTLGTCAISHEGLKKSVMPVLKDASALVHFEATSIYSSRAGMKDLRKEMNVILFENLKRVTSALTDANDGVKEEMAEIGLGKVYTTYEEFLGGDGLRLLKSPGEDQVKWIRSIYRTRDMGKARRGEIVLVKKWDENDQTLEMVSKWEDK